MICFHMYRCLALCRAARRGARGARTVRATAAAVGPGAVRGAGGMALGGGGTKCYQRWIMKI